MSELVLTELQTNQSFDLQVGNPVLIRLPENPASGFRWNLDHLDESVMTVEGSEFSQTPGSGVGGGGIRTITLLPRGPGVTHLSIKNRRVWEGGASAVGQFEATFRVSQ
jgi:inhibitor of cysteine peptidase